EEVGAGSWAYNRWPWGRDTGLPSDGAAHPLWLGGRPASQGLLQHPSIRSFPRRLEAALRGAHTHGLGAGPVYHPGLPLEGLVSEPVLPLPPTKQMSTTSTT